MRSTSEQCCVRVLLQTNVCGGLHTGGVFYGRSSSSLLKLRVSLVCLPFVRMNQFLLLPLAPVFLSVCLSALVAVCQTRLQVWRRQGLVGTPCPVAHPAATPAPPGNAGTQGRVSPVGRSIALSGARFRTPTPSTDEPHADSPCSAVAAFCAAVCRNQGLYWPGRAAHGVDWPRLAEAWGSLARNLALRGASGAPAG